MSRLPAPAQIDELLADLDVSIAGLPTTKVRFKRLLTRDRRGGSTIPDGWPTRGGDGGHGGSSSSSVESAVLARCARHADPVHSAACTAAQALSDAVSALQRLGNALEQAERTEHHAPPPEAGCSVMAKVGVYEPVLVAAPKGMIGKPLGRWAYGFVLRVGRLPTLEECTARAQGRRVMLPAEQAKAEVAA